MTMGQARRAAGIPERDYLRHNDSVDRIATIRCLARILGPPDNRTDHLVSCQLHWTVDRDPEIHVAVSEFGALTS